MIQRKQPHIMEVLKKKAGKTTAFFLLSVVILSAHSGLTRKAFAADYDGKKSVSLLMDKVSSNISPKEKLSFPASLIMFSRILEIFPDEKENFGSILHTFTASQRQEVCGFIDGLCRTALKMQEYKEKLAKTGKASPATLSLIEKNLEELQEKEKYLLPEELTYFDLTIIRGLGDKIKAAFIYPVAKEIGIKLPPEYIRGNITTCDDNAIFEYGYSERFTKALGNLEKKEEECVNTIVKEVNKQISNYHNDNYIVFDSLTEKMEAFNENVDINTAGKIAITIEINRAVHYLEALYVIQKTMDTVRQEAFAKELWEELEKEKKEQHLPSHHNGIMVPGDDTFSAKEKLIFIACLPHRQKT